MSKVIAWTPHSRGVDEEGPSRDQVISKDTNPRYYGLIEEMERWTGSAVVLNTSLNRRGEPMVCALVDALNMFYGSGLQYPVMENVLVRKIQDQTTAA